MNAIAEKVHLLDNPVYYALKTNNKNVALGTSNVKFYDPEVSLFVGLKENNNQFLKELHRLVANTNAHVFGLHANEEMKIEAPWNLLKTIPLYQMVCWQPVLNTNKSTIHITNLTEKDTSKMKDLVAVTQPGPFNLRTIELGHYQGVFNGDQLIAMAGQRIHCSPFAEISAVCTHPHFQGRGYGTQLLKSQMQRILNAGEVPFLHVARNNANAIKVYKNLGFEIRKEMFVYVIEK